MGRRFRLTVAYDGSGFHGFAEHDGVRTVMGDLRAAMERVLQVPMPLVGAGRTDAGVHAWGQVVSGDLPDAVDDAGLADLQRRLNKMLAPEIAVRDGAFTTDPEFSARFSATYRHYRYLVYNAPVHHPLLARTAWHLRQPLALWAMNLACDPIIGEHDFATFCRRPKTPDDQPPVSLVRRVLSAEWFDVPGDVPGMLRFEIRATAFCHQMVRSLVGTMVDVGLGRLHAGDMRAMLLRRDRAAAGQVAPPHGLVLWEVGYSDADGGPSH